METKSSTTTGSSRTDAERNAASLLSPKEVSPTGSRATGDIIDVPKRTRLRRRNEVIDETVPVLSDDALEKLTTVRTDVLPVRGSCTVCRHPDCAGIERAIMNTVSDSDDPTVADDRIRQIAKSYGLKPAELVKHRNLCMIRKMATELAQSSPASNRLAMENSATWINRMSYYLSKVDDQIERLEHRGNDEGSWDEKQMLASIAEARKICTANAELFIKVYQLRVDKRVQDDFIKIVMEEVDRVSPEIRDRIINRLTSRLALANAAGVAQRGSGS